MERSNTHVSVNKRKDCNHAPLHVYLITRCSESLFNRKHYVEKEINGIIPLGGCDICLPPIMG